MRFLAVLAILALGCDERACREKASTFLSDDKSTDICSANQTVEVEKIFQEGMLTHTIVVCRCTPPPKRKQP